MKQNIDIQSFLLEHIPEHPKDIVTFTQRSLKLSRTTIQRHINHLINKKKIAKRGKTKSIHYLLLGDFKNRFDLDLTKKLDEFRIFKEFFIDFEDRLKNNVLEICSYGFTEMVNNAMDHSQGTQLIIESSLKNTDLIIDIIDNGIGIFQKIANAIGLADNREAVIELNKGKFTTDPSNHTGEGIFFTSRIFDEFQIISNNLEYTRNNFNEDWFLHKCLTKKGTHIRMSIDINSCKNLVEFFEKYQDNDSYKFNRTEITVALCKIDGELYISRSQAKRIVRNLDKFDIITLDFKGVRVVGQGFVDEIFRIFKNKFPHIQINYINANDDIVFMIKRGLSY